MESRQWIHYPAGQLFENIVILYHHNYQYQGSVQNFKVDENIWQHWDCTTSSIDCIENCVISGGGVNIRYHQIWKVCQIWETFHIWCWASTWLANQTLLTMDRDNQSDQWISPIPDWLWRLRSVWHDYNDVIMGAMASQITSLTSVYATVYTYADQKKYQSSASLAFVWGIHRWPVNSPHKGSVTRKSFHLMTSSWVGRRQEQILCYEPQKLHWDGFRHSKLSSNIHITQVHHDDVIKWKHFPRYKPLCGEFTGHWWPVVRSFDVFFNLRLKKRLSKESRGWWFETPLRPLWCHSNVLKGKPNSIVSLFCWRHAFSPAI